MLNKIWLIICHWLVRRRFYKWILYNVMPYLRASTYYALPSNPRYKKWGALAEKGYQKLQPGDIILTLDEKKLASIIIGAATAEEDPDSYPFIPSHAALCVSKDRSFEIAEMTHLDYTESTWHDVCYESTRVVILRCNDFDKDYINNVLIPKSLSFRGKKYDVKFVQGIDELICSELVYFSDKERRLIVNLDPVLGFEPYISPVGLLKAKNCIIIWDSDLEE